MEKHIQGIMPWDAMATQILVHPVEVFQLQILSPLVHYASFVNCNHTRRLLINCYAINCMICFLALMLVGCMWGGVMKAVCSMVV